ncbi:MAG: ATP-binding protein [Planctomycetia bacterium]
MNDSRSQSPQPIPWEATLRDTAALWRAICLTSDDFLVVVDRDRTIRFCSQVDDGLTVDQVVGRHIDAFTTPESAQTLRDAIDDVFRTGTTHSVETTVRQLNGSVNYFSIRLGPIHVAGEIAGVLACCHSILPLKESEQTLQHERQVLRRLLEIQEQERQLVSYEIHDGLSQYLAGAMMHLQSLEHASGPAAERRELLESLRLLRAAVDESRRLISGLRPPALDELGIVDAVESLVADARLDIPTVSFTHELPKARLSSQLETGIFRIVQESLSNARKHSNARTVEVRIARRDGDRPGTIRVTVHDDGIGFDPSCVPEDRFGLEGIRQRSRLLAGEAVIASAPGQGTTITVDLPLLVGNGT